MASKVKGNLSFFVIIEDLCNTLVVLHSNGPQENYPYSRLQKYVN